MVATMQAEVVSAERHVLTAEVRELYARGVEGEIGILPGHQPALIALDVGAVKLVLADGTTEVIAVHNGLLFVGEDGTAIVLADVAERREDIDVGRADQRRRELESQLHSDSGSKLIQESLRKQQLRLQVAQDLYGRA